MDIQLREKLDYLEALLLLDKRYAAMKQECSLLEERFDQMVKALPEEQQAIAWDFVMGCEDMSRYALQLACFFLDLPQGASQNTGLR